MNYIKKSRNYIFIFLFFSCLGSFIYFYRVNQLTSVDALASYIVYPVIYTTSFCVDHIKKFLLVFQPEQHAFITQLQQEKESLQEQVIKLQGTLHYIEKTHRLHEFAKRYDTSYALCAQIIGTVCTEQQKYIFIDAGAHKGIELDMVAVYKNCLLGRVMQVFPWYSKVVLITDPGCKVGAFCSTTKAQGIHEGVQGTAYTQLSFVSRLETVQQGDMIVSSGEGFVFPRGFGIGTVKEVRQGELYYSVLVEPLVDISRIHYCYIMKKGST